ncbi:MAG: tetratricopeptide repeat protein [Methylotenera sp.]
MRLKFSSIRITSFFLIALCVSCSAVSPQQQLNFEGNNAFTSRQYELAFSRYQKALAAAYKKNDQQYIAISMYGLGRTSIKLCRLTEGETWLKQSIVARDSLPDTGAAIITQNLAELARLYIAQQRYAEANSLLDRAMPLLYAMKLEKSDPIALANQLDEYDKSLRGSGRTAEADAIAMKSEQLRQSNLGKYALFRPEPIPQYCLVN